MADPAAPHLPLQPGEWAIPRVPLRHDRATIAAAVVQTRLRIARRTVRRAAHRPPARPEQLALFDPGGPSAGSARRRGVDLEALRTGLDALHFTADELRRMTEAFTATGDAARRRTRQHPRPRPAAGDTPRTHRQERRRPPEVGPDPGGGVRR
ncbi:hypothetical protein [Streptomyces megasporus]|uniref:hypothetical protein n=1 Tax=Streptomyces megasporus TaxID=44060 RepID=UPI0004E12368|nr:hypothetical protein [Streptomyces megasporus]